MVRLYPMRGDLVDTIAVGPMLLRADRAEPLALGPDGIGPATQQQLDLVGPGVGGGVEVEQLATRGVGGGARQQVAHRAADEVEAMPGCTEAFAERRQLVEHGLETSRDHHSSSRSQ